MNRLPILLTITLTIAVFGFVSQAMAFSLTWGKGTAVMSVNQTTNGADIPTPKLLNVTAGQPSAPIALSFAPTNGEPSSTLHMVHPKTKPVIATQSNAQTPKTTIAHHLNGPELFLLRQVHTVAKQQSGK